MASVDRIVTPKYNVGLPATANSRGRALGVLASLWLCACAAALPAASKESDDDRLLASISVTNAAHSGPVRRRNGFFFYVRKEPGVAGPMLEGYEYRDGKQIDSFGGGSDSADVIAAIEKVGLVPFDFDREVQTLSARLGREAQQRGEPFLGAQARDGAEFEIVIETGSGRLSLRAWNPGVTIDAFASHSENIAKLKAVIDLLSQYYGRLKIGV